MKRTQPYSLIPIPATIAPTSTKCYTVNVPDDPTHIAAFMGMISRLATWQVWDSDSAHSGKDCAAVWRDVFDNIQECPMIEIRLKPTDFCTIQLSTDGGTTWTDVADLSACAHSAAVSEIQDAIGRGDLSAGGQQPGQGSGNPGQCYDYDITLAANQRWNSPVAVQDGDILTVSSVMGAWSSVTPLGAWHCGDGENYVLGACAGGGVTESTDPAPSVLHMRLIGNLPTDTTTPYFDMFNTAYTVPSGVALGDFYLQANDSVLSDNQGSVTFHVQICKAGWHHFFDFSTGANGWTVSPGHVGSGGIIGDFVDGFNQSEAGVTRSISATTIIRMSVVYDMSAQSGANGASRFATTPGGVYGAYHSATGTDLVIDELATKLAVTSINFDCNSGSAAASSRIKTLDIWGLGTDPF